MNNIPNGMSQSARDFLKVVWPKIISLNWLNGELVPVEVTSNKPWTKELDTLAGIDAWLVKDKVGLTGIASRVQWRPPPNKDKNNRYPYNTFNMRWQLPSGLPTEYEKRLRAINSAGELIYPYWSCHAYLESKISGPVLSLGLCKTTDLVEALGMWGLEMPNTTDNNVFRYVSFALLLNKGYQIFTYPSVFQGRLLTVTEAIGY